jgi:hypothetical protein
VHAACNILVEGGWAAAMQATGLRPVDAILQISLHLRMSAS